MRRRALLRHARLLRLACVVVTAWLPARAAAAPEQSPTASSQQVVIGPSTLALYGPWKFHVGDSPLDPATHLPLWASPDFDDSQWESVDLTPEQGVRGPAIGDTDYVPGWTAKGHPHYWGYAWYRIKLRFDAASGRKLALAGPSQVDDAYEVFFAGKLLGSFGKFDSSRPVTYYAQPMMFALTAPETGAGAQVLAFRVWMEPNTLATTADAGGFHSAPVLGDVEAVTATHQLRWLTLVRNYSPFAVTALLFGLLAMVAFSLVLFDRSDKVYLWMGAVFTLTAVYSALDALDVWTQHLSVMADSLIVQCFLGPLAYAGWVMVWWLWFKRQRPVWMPKAAAGLALIYMVSNAIAIELFFDWIPHPVAAGFEVVSVIVRLLFFALLLWIVVQGIRRQGLEGWLVLPAVVLLGLGLFQIELAIQHVQLNWFPLGMRVAVAQIANILLVGALALLLLRRLLLSVQRQRAIQMDAQRAQLQSDFVAAVSHEFRSPLTTLRTIIELLVQGRIEEEDRRQQSYVFLEREAARLHRLVEDLLDFGRMESGRKQYRMERLDAFDRVRATIAEFEQLAAANGFHVEAELPPRAAAVYADEEALGRALRNLLENAMKYSPVCRTVWVQGRVSANQVLISVRDQGLGIDEAEKPVIFQKFVRGSAAKKAGIKGTGIGLAMVQQIAEALGGTVQVESELGVGSTFTLVLPLASK